MGYTYNLYFVNSEYHFKHTKFLRRHSVRKMYFLFNDSIPYCFHSNKKRCVIWDKHILTRAPALKKI